VDEEKTSAEQPRTRWFIGLDWYQQHNRSLPVLAQSYLCPKCAEKLSAGEGEPSIDTLLATISGCCSGAPGYIHDQLSIMESVFRLFLANGNQPLYLEELSKQLSEWRGGDTYRTSAEILPRLLNKDRYYGLREIED